MPSQQEPMDDPAGISIPGQTGAAMPPDENDKQAQIQAIISDAEMPLEMKQQKVLELLGLSSPQPEDASVSSVPSRESQEATKKRPSSGGSTPSGGAGPMPHETPRRDPHPMGSKAPEEKKAVFSRVADRIKNMTPKQKAAAAALAMSGAAGAGYAGYKLMKKKKETKEAEDHTTPPTGGVRPPMPDDEGEERLPGEEGDPTGGLIPEKDTEVYESVQNQFLELLNSTESDKKQLGEKLVTKVLMEAVETVWFQEELEYYKNKDVVRTKQDTARKLCKDMELQESLQTKVFMDQLLQAPNEQYMKDLIEDRKIQHSIRNPVSGPGHIGRKEETTQPPENKKEVDTKDFASKLRRTIHSRN